MDHPRQCAQLQVSFSFSLYTPSVDGHQPLQPRENQTPMSRQSAPTPSVLPPTRPLSSKVFFFYYLCGSHTSTTTSVSSILILFSVSLLPW